MESKNTELPLFKCSGGSEKCDLHFLVENEIISTKGRLDSLERNSSESFKDMQRTLSDFANEVRTYMGIQGFRDRDHDEVKNITKTNTSEIHDIKATLKILVDSGDNTKKSMSEIKDSISDLTRTMKDIDKSIVSEDRISKMVKSAITEEAKSRKDKWFEAVPAKLSVTVAAISFIAFFIFELVKFFIGV